MTITITVQPDPSPSLDQPEFGAGYAVDGVRSYPTCAAVRALSPVVYAPTLLVASRQFTWSNTANPALDTGTESTSVIAITGVATGAYVESGALSQSPIAAGSGTVSVSTVTGASPALPFAVPASTIVRAEVDARFSSAGSKAWNGTLVGTAKRVGSGSLAVTAQSFAAGVELEGTWNPQLVAVGNNLQLQITADSSQVIIPRGKVRIDTQDTSADPSLTLATARAAVLADSYNVLLYPDIGTTPTTPSVNTLITAWTDQSAAAHAYVATSGNQAAYKLDGNGKPYLAFTKAGGEQYAVADAMASGSITYRWRMGIDGSSHFGVVFNRHDVGHYVIVNSAGGGSWNTDGDKIVIAVDGTYRTIGTQLSGVHDYEVRISVGGTSTATLLVDGVAQTPVTLGTVVTNGYTPFIGSAGDASICPTIAFYGCGIKAGVGTDAETARWNAMMTLASGAHS